MIQDLIFGFFFFFFWKSSTFQWTYESFFLISNFLAESLKAKAKTSEKDYLFYNTVSLKKRHSFYEPQLTLKITCSRNTANNLSNFTNFQQTFFCFVLEKKHLHCAFSGRPRNGFLKHFESKCLYIFVYPRQKMFVPET